MVAELDSDTRVRAAWLAGSFGRGTADDWSDIDLGCVVRDDAFMDWLGDLDGLFRRVGTPLLIGSERDVSGPGTGRSRSVLFVGPVSLDIDAFPDNSALQPLDIRLLFERTIRPIRPPDSPGDAERVRQAEQSLAFFWAMTPIALKYVGRGWTARAVTQIDLLRDTVVQLWRLASQRDRLGAARANWLHPIEDAGIIEKLPRLGSVIDPNAALDAVRILMSQVILLHPAIEGQGVNIPVHAVWEVEALFGAVAAMAVPLSPSGTGLDANHHTT